MSNSPTANKDATFNEGRSLRRRQKCEAHLTSGCGFGKSKKRLIDGFWASMWPGLEELGWTKVSTILRNFCSMFLRGGQSPAELSAPLGTK